MFKYSVDIFYIFICMLVMVLVVTLANEVFASTCNQHMYDEIYKRIIQQALIEHTLSETEKLKRKNETIYQLRALCNGQYSTYERPNQ